MERCIAEAERYKPLESGGVFMGYWADQQSLVVTSIVGAGPMADRGYRHFEPDYDWQLGEIARQYEASGRRHVYLGDWHSHPGQENAELSRKDRRVLRKIIEAPNARAPRPIMGIVYGTDGQIMKMMVWLAELKPRSFFWPELIIRGAILKPF